MGWFSGTTVYTGGVSVTHLIDKLPENPLKAAVIDAIRNDYSLVDAILSARSKTMFVRVKEFYDLVKADPNLKLPSENFPSQLGDPLPIITVREDRNDLLSSGNAAKIEATEKVLSKVGLSLKNLTTAVNDGPGTVDDVYVMLAANVWSTTPGTAEYFFRLFEKLYDPVYDQQWWMGLAAVNASDAFDAAKVLRVARADLVAAKAEVAEVAAWGVSASGAYYVAITDSITTRRGTSYTANSARDWINATLATGNIRLVYTMALYDGISATDLDRLMAWPAGTAFSTKAAEAASWRDTAIAAEAAALDALLNAVMTPVAPGTFWLGQNSPLDRGYKIYRMNNGSEYSQAFRYLTIKKETINGTIGPEGYFVKSLIVYNDTSTNTYKNVISLYNITNVGYEDLVDLHDLGEMSNRHNFDSIVVSKQISPTQYETYTIYGLTTLNAVKMDDGSYRTAIHTVMGGSHRAVDRPDLMINGASYTFVLPLFTSISSEMSSFTQEQFISDSLILYIHTVSSSKIAWYKSPVFMWIVGAIIIVLVTIATWGTGTVQATLAVSGFVAAVQATVVAVLVNVAIAVAISIIIKAIVAILKPFIGETAALIVSTVAVIAVMVATGYVDVSSMPWAEMLLKAGAVVIDLASSAIQIESAKDLLELTAEVAGFTAYAGLVTKELDRGMDLLGTIDDNLVYGAARSILIVKETPDDFYNRTIHQGNVGILGIDAVASYTSTKLTLPKEFPS